MAAAVRKISDAPSRKVRARPATTPEARENQLIGLAVDLAEKQLVDGTASAQVINHFLRLATVKEQLERQKLEAETRLKVAQVEAMAQAQVTQELYDSAIKAMRSYQGQTVEGDYED